MSSKPHQIAGTEKPSRYERAAAEAADFNYCPHCGDELDGRRLAEHMGRDACREHDEPNLSPPPTPDEPEIEPPTLDNHDEREHTGADLDARRALADKLAEKEIWTEDTAASGD